MIKRRFCSRGGDQSGALDCDTEVAPLTLREGEVNTVRYTYRVMWNVRLNTLHFEPGCCILTYVAIVEQESSTPWVGNSIFSTANGAYCGVVFAGHKMG